MVYIKTPKTIEEAVILYEKLLEVDAKGTVALAEIDHDLREWQKELNGLPDEEDNWKDIGWMSNDGVTFHI